MKKAILFSLLLLTLLVISPVAAQTGFGDLEPGEFVTLEQEIPINLVFIGYERDEINRDEMHEILPESYDPVVRYPRFYGLSGREIGLHYEFDYNFVFANDRFEDSFFSYLEEIGTPGALTDYQQAYNDQETNVLDVSASVLYIDGPSTEQWLASHSRRLGVNIQQSYTVYFVNWYSQADFQFHVYTKTDEPDPDTGVNFGEVYDSRKLIAWGGEHSRTWFYDLSAGPEWNTTNYIVDVEDLDGDGVPEYRMPPIWEYTLDGYRDPSKLSEDLAAVTRFVAINLLFTTSPLYDPLVTAPKPGGDKVVHIEMFEDDPSSSGLDFIDRGYIHEALADLEPYYDWEVNLEDNDPIDEGAERAFRIFTGLSEEEDCWTLYGTPFAELFCYFDANLDQYVPAYDDEDYVAEVFAFNTTDENMGEWFGLLGYADDNWVDGTQTYVFEFDYPAVREAGYGFSTTTVHEVGHHIGLSHPHDGYDSELDIDYGPGGEFYYAWVGDESDTVMQYLALSNYFSEFDKDNMYRIETAGYLNWSSELGAALLAHPDVHTVEDLIQQAAREAERSIQAFHDWDYLTAVRLAREAYLTLVQAAEELGIEAPHRTLAARAIPAQAIEHPVDFIRHPGN